MTPQIFGTGAPRRQLRIMQLVLAAAAAIAMLALFNAAHPETTGTVLGSVRLTALDSPVPAAPPGVAGGLAADDSNDQAQQQEQQALQQMQQSMQEAQQQNDEAEQQFNQDMQQQQTYENQFNNP
jgi:hypothetical protein